MNNAELRNPTAVGRPEILWVDGEVLVHDIIHGKVHVLNGSAGRVLQLCDGTRSIPDIALLISGPTGAPLPTVTRDVEAVVADFVNLQLVQM